VNERKAIEQRGVSDKRTMTAAQPAASDRPCRMEHGCVAATAMTTTAWRPLVIARTRVSCDDDGPTGCGGDGRR